ncbi:MAG TPA: hypothetical protein VHB50_10705 [Bryobacteraceae bacterium]|nr:hypothetical protein [Bryobacteraceae bacterium]
MPLSVLKDIRKIYAGLNADEIRGTAWQDVNVGLMASHRDVYDRMERFLAPPALDPYSRAQALRAIHPADGQPDRFDFVLCEPGIPVPRNGYTFESDGSGSLINAIVGEHQDREMALARTFPMFRPAVAGKINARVSRENAFFAIVTALPNVVPSLLELPWTIGEFATDTAFLTMNQVRMALMLAATHGRPVGYAEQKAEIAGIVAGAFGWRAIARELVGKIPLGGGLIPKAAVAFAGTYVIGLGLDKVNRTGSGLTKEERRDAYADAFARGKEVVRELAPSLREEKEPTAAAR